METWQDVNTRTVFLAESLCDDATRSSLIGTARRQAHAFAFSHHTPRSKSARNLCTSFSSGDAASFSD
jgi:hypothetical protein